MFLLLGGWFLFRNKPAGPYFLTPGVLLVVFGLVAPRSLKIAYIAWMSLAFIIGLLVSAVVVTIFYFLVITPIGIGGDYLARTSFPKNSLPTRRAISWCVTDTRNLPKRLIGKQSLNSIDTRRTTRPSAGSRFFAGVSLATFRTFCQ